MLYYLKPSKPTAARPPARGAARWDARSRRASPQTIIIIVSIIVIIIIISSSSST